MNDIANLKSKLTNWLSSLRSKPALSETDAAIEKDSLAMQSRLKGAIQFLKTTQITRQGKQIKLNSFPWYILIGQVDSGKSSLLSNANLNFILEKQSNQQNNSNDSNQCDWWITQDLVVIDVPGELATLKNRKLSHDNKLWHAFINNIVKLRGKDALSGAIIAISLPELMQRQNRDQLVDSLKYQVSLLKDRFGNDLPIYFIITKCDLIPGFVDFFGDCSMEELGQAWGIPFTSEDIFSFSETFLTRFNALIKRLNKQLIWRLHQERNPRAKVYIKDFPLQVERVKEALADVFKTLTSTQAGICQIRGVYLCSALQPVYEEKKEEHYPQTMSADQFQQSLQIMRSPDVPKQSYFIKQIFQQALPSLRTIQPTPSKHWVMAGAAASVLLVGAIIFGEYFLLKGNTNLYQGDVSLRPMPVISTNHSAASAADTHST